MGTIVFPDAQLKIFMEASADERAQRRYKQLSAKGIEARIATLREEIRARDERDRNRSEEHTSELQSLMRISYAVFCLKKKKNKKRKKQNHREHDQNNTYKQIHTDRRNKDIDKNDKTT